MDFVDWCGHVLRKLIEVGRDPHIDEIRLAQILYGEEFRTAGDFHHSTHRRGMLDAVNELGKLGLIEGRSSSFWTVMPEGRAFDDDPAPFWQHICSVKLEPDEQRILKVVNALGAKVGSNPPHAWLEEVDRGPLLKEYGITAGMDMLEVLWPVSEDLERRGLVYRDARAGWHLDLKPTYAGLVWETRRHLLRKCDVFISHATAERGAALAVQKFLLAAFGEDFKVFVSSDYRSIRGGKVWFQELTEALTSAPVVLTLLSEDSVGRRWINFESGVGYGAGRLVIPLALAGFSKDAVGVPLSILQTRSLSDPEDVAAILNEIEEHTGRQHGEVDAAAFVNESYSVGGAKLQATVNHVPEKHYDGYREHALLVGLVNNSSKTINEFWVEVELPDAITNQSTTYMAEVQGRRTHDTRYFRQESKNSGTKTLRPGDKVQSFFKIDLVIPPGAKEGGSLDRKITVKVFAGDDMTQKIELTVRQLLTLEPSFG